MTPSTHLSGYSVNEIVAAAEYAAAIGTPFNYAITLSLGLLTADVGLDPRVSGSVQKFIGRLLDALRRCLRRLGLTELSYVGTFERSGDLGIHVHLFAHVPEGLRRAAQTSLRTSLMALIGRPPPPRVLNTKAADAGWLHYLLKEASPAVLGACGVPNTHERKATNGVVYGRRHTISQTLTLAARENRRTRIAFAVTHPKSDAGEPEPRRRQTAKRLKPLPSKRQPSNHQPRLGEAA